MMRSLLASTLSAVALLTSAPALAQDSFAIINAKVVTNTDIGNGDNLTVLVENGVIKAIGNTDTSPNAPQPNGTTIIDGTGKWVTPGLFAPFSELGLVEVSAESATNDRRASESKMSVSLKAADSFNPKTSSIAATLMEGVTFAAIAPQASQTIFGGTGAIIDMSGDFDSVLNDSAFIYVVLGESGAENAGGSRAAAMAQLRAALSDASAYPSRYKTPTDGDVLPRADAAALAPAVRGRMPIMIRAGRASDIKAVIDLKAEFKLPNVIILGGAEGWMIADSIAASGVPILLDPSESLPSSFEQIATLEDNATRLHAAGVTIGFMTRTSGISHQTRLLAQHAGLAVANGLPWNEAFKAITVTPAQIYGQPKLGRLTAGETANLVIWDGDPLEVMSAPDMVLIDGEIQDLSSRQTALRDRYNPSVESNLPFKYR